MGARAYADRDVKSSNVLLTEAGDGKLGDVGLSKMAGYFSSSSNTVGTFCYAAPELLLAMPCSEKVSQVGLLKLNYLIPYN